MFYWRVTKYNPSGRDINGAYTENEWTSSSDINSSFNGKVLTIEEYMKVENAYAAAVLHIMECVRIPALRITALEKHGFRPSELIYSVHMKEVFENIHIDSLIPKEILQS